ncbi:hypothetical protein [Staphylococcus gallinarum]|uniref:hypothetical protein n=1 Tax=Staphylococcus gallinarum TaxID=1293 RepID=UPI000D1DD64E|nr:hypothetical protein [Staphylococcus gallinarum]PTK89724.1 hypothetical protein BUZ13_11205 [Staphylococcus gallinarum]PTK89857.1 hypothetical protein BUZ05_11215 [Staphylococcus gallinarum]RIO87564.1 hypothetical protein BUZ06_10275 [Staphylococcus gallinarum]
MNKRFISGIKGGSYVFVCPILLALLLNFMDFDFGYNRFWTYLGNLELITFFDNKQLNGLIILGFILGVIAFVLVFLFPDNEKSKDGERK